MEVMLGLTLLVALMTITILGHNLFIARRDRDRWARTTQWMIQKHPEDLQGAYQYWRGESE